MKRLLPFLVLASSFSFAGIAKASYSHVLRPGAKAISYPFAHHKQIEQGAVRGVKHAASFVKKVVV